MNQNLTNEEKLVVNSELEKRGKNLVLAYVLWFFLGTLGIHRMYLGKKGSGIVMLVMFLVSYPLILAYGLGFITLSIVGIWYWIDLFRIKNMHQQEQDILESEIAEEILAGR